MNSGNRRALVASERFAKGLDLFFASHEIRCWVWDFALDALHRPIFVKQPFVQVSGDLSSEIVRSAKLSDRMIGFELFSEGDKLHGSRFVVSCSRVYDGTDCEVDAAGYMTLTSPVVLSLGDAGTISPADDADAPAFLLRLRTRGQSSAGMRG